MTHFAMARRTMVDNQLRTGAVTDKRVLTAMGEVPREPFLPEARWPLAYTDVTHVLQAGEGRAMAAPAPFARFLQLAAIGPDESVLDVGSGAGYSAAVISKLARSVVAVEGGEELPAAAREIIGRLGIANVTVVSGTPLEGASKLGPFDVIVVEGAVEAVPEPLLRQLKQGGRLVAPIGWGSTPEASIFVRRGNDFAPRAEFDLAMPPLSRAPAPSVFTF